MKETKYVAGWSSEIVNYDDYYKKYYRYNPIQGTKIFDDKKEAIKYIKKLIRKQAKEMGIEKEFKISIPEKRNVSVRFGEDEKYLFISNHDGEEDGFETEFWEIYLVEREDTQDLLGRDRKGVRIYYNYFINECD